MPPVLRRARGCRDATSRTCACMPRRWPPPTWNQQLPVTGRAGAGDLPCAALL